MGTNFIVNDTNPDSKFRKLLDLIPVGEENAVSMATLAMLLNTDDRQVRKFIELARCEGNVIAGGDSGYFVPANLVELQHYFNRSMARIKTNSRSLNAVRARLRQEGMNVSD